MTPCDPDFLAWWRLWLLLHSGNGTLADVAQASFHWQMAIETRRRLNDL
jgi:hypothetical protein